MSRAGSVLLDTSVIIAHFRGDAEVTGRLSAAHALYVPWVVIGELHYGARRSRRPEHEFAVISEFLKSVVPVFPDQSTGAWYGELKAELAAAGTPIPENDIWIATIARQFDLTLATRDSHFSAVSRLETLAW